MQNINEFIGIIKGINFDGIINDKEVLHLQSWLSKNKNLVYEQRQVEFVKLVENALKDRIINDEERLQMLEYAEQLIINGDYTANKFYELLGIVEGIVCDQIINEAETNSLVNWLNIHEKELQISKECKSIYITLTKVLEDGLITKEEQNELHDILIEQISSSHFETKLEYLCELVENRENIGIELIEILDNDNAMKEIHKRAEIQLRGALCSSLSYIEKPEIIVVSLTLIAMLKYDGNYYENVRNTYLEVYKRYSEQKVEGLIRSILSKYKKNSDISSRSRIINVVLENSIVPQEFLSEFFEFIFDIYKLNFNYDLPQTLTEDFRFVFEGLRNNMVSDVDDISINVTQKTYKLIASTKKLIMSEQGIEVIIKLSVIIVRLIEKAVWNREVQIYNPYLKVGFEEWKKRFIKDNKEVKARSRKNDELHSRWEPKFILKNKEIVLVPPIHKIKSQYDYTKVKIVILNDGEEIYSNEKMDIREIIGGYQINAEKFILAKPLGKVVYKLLVGEDVIYDSKEKLFRDYIIFDEDGYEIFNNTDYEGTAYFCYKNEQVDIKNFFEQYNYNLGYKLIRNGDVVLIGKEIINFSSMMKPGIFGMVHKNCFVKSEEDNTSYQVYKEISAIVFETEDSVNNFEILINGISHKLDDFNYQKKCREGIIKYIIEPDLKESDIYIVEVNQLIDGRKVKIFNEVFAFDPHLEYRCELRNKNVFKVKVLSELLMESVVRDVSVKTFDENFIKFQNNTKNYIYVIPFDFGFYKVDNQEWNSIETDLWIEDISLDSLLTLYDSECDELMIYAENGVLVEEKIKLLDKGYYKQVLIGFLNSYKMNNKYIMLLFNYDGKTKYAVPCYNKCILDAERTEIVFTDDPKEILVSPVYHGKNDVFFEIIDSNNNLIYKSKILKNREIDSVSDFESFEEYTINFYENTKKLMLRKNTLLATFKRVFYAKDDLVNKVLKVEEVFFNQYIRGEFLEKSYHFNKIYISIDKKIGNSTFEGSVMVRTIYGEWYLNNINPVCIEICSEVIDDTIDVYITNEGDGLLIDFKKGGILNSMDHPTAPDIFLYTIDLKGGINN